MPGSRNDIKTSLWRQQSAIQPYIYKWEYVCPLLKRDSSTICLFLSIKSHILNSNGVRYSLFWSEGSINPLNIKILVPDFVPRYLEWRGTWDLEWRCGGTSNGGTQCVAIQGPWSKPLGTKSRTKIVKFWYFLDPSDQSELYHSPLQ